MKAYPNIVFIIFHSKFKMSKETSIHFTPKNDLNISLLTKSLFKQNITLEPELSLPILKSPLSAPKQCQQPEDLEEPSKILHSKLINLLRAKLHTKKIQGLLAICDLQVLIFLKFQEGIDDFIEHVLPLISGEKEFEELREFFWKTLDFNDQQFLSIFIEKLPLKDWINLIFHSAPLLNNHNGLATNIKLILRKLIEINEEYTALKSRLLIEIVRSLDHKNKETVVHKISKEFINDNILNYQLVIEDYIMNKNNQKSDDFEGFLRALYTIYKSTPIMMLPIIDKLENLSKSLVKNKNLKTNIIIFFGRIASFKNSKFYSTHARILESFFYTVNEKSFLLKRNEIIQILFRFLKKFCFVNANNQKNFNNNYDENSKLIKMCHTCEKKIIECLFISEKSQETKQMILNQILLNQKKKNHFFSIEFLKSFFGHIDTQTHFMKEKCSILLSEVFALYYSGMFTDKCNIFYNINRVVVHQGQVECKLHNLQETSKKFEWIILDTLFKFNEIEKKEYLLYLNSINKVFFGESLLPSERTTYLLGIFYLIIKNFFDSKEHFPDLKTKGYEEYLSKILGSEWKLQEDSLKNKKPFFILRGLEIVMKIKFKISKLIKKWVNEENQKKDFLAKILKYSDFLKFEKNENNIKSLNDFCEIFDEDKGFRTHFKNILESCQKNHDPQADHKGYFSEDFFKKCSSELVFFLNFLELNKNFDVNIVGELLKHCLNFSEQLRNYEDQKEMLFLLSGLKAVHLFVKYSEYPFENTKNLNNAIEIVERMYLLIEEKKEMVSTTTSRNFEMSSLKQFALTLVLKIASKFNNYLEIPNIEEKKKLFKNMLKMSGLNDDDYKYLAIILLKFDEISSEKDFLGILNNSLNNLDVRNSNLSKNINLILYFVKYQIKYHGSNDCDFISKGQSNLYEKYLETIEKPVVLSKTLLISNLTVNKMKTLKLMYLLLFKTSQKYQDENSITSLKETFISTLFEILVNFNTISASSLLADKNYLRIKALEILFKIINKNLFPDHLTSLALIKLSYLCFEENLTFRKVFFKYLIKFISHLDNPIALKFLALVVLFTLDEDSTLTYVSRNVMGKFNKILGEQIKIFLEDKKVFSTTIFEKSPEYLLIYLVFLVTNNNYFSVKNSSLDLFKVVKLMQNFVDLVFQNGAHFRTLSFLAIILENLKRKKPKLLKISHYLDFKFYSLSKKTMKIWNKQIPESLENKAQNSILTAVSSISSSMQTYDEKYYFLMDVLSEMMKKNFNNRKLDSIKKDIIIPIDLDFYESKEENEKISENLEEKSSLENKVTEKKSINEGTKTNYKISVTKTKENTTKETKLKEKKEKASKKIKK